MKYVGSKAKIARDIVPILQEYIDKNNIKLYVEPFVGGFNVIDKIRCNRRIGVDIDNLVIDLVQACVQEPDLLENLPQLPTKEHYYDVRDNGFKYENWYRSAILLFGSYNARVYGGCYGAFAKTKDGKTRNYFQESKKNFQKQLPLLKDIETYCMSYEYINPRNALIYCDIPYKDSIGYSTYFDREIFFKWCDRQVKNNNIVLISEYNIERNGVECIWEKQIITHQNNRKKLDKVERLYLYKGENKC